MFDLIFKIFFMSQINLLPIFKKIRINWFIILKNFEELQFISPFWYFRCFIFNWVISIEDRCRTVWTSWLIECYFKFVRVRSFVDCFHRFLGFKLGIIEHFDECVVLAIFIFLNLDTFRVKFISRKSRVFDWWFVFWLRWWLDIFLVRHFSILNLQHFVFQEIDNWWFHKFTVTLRVIGRGV